MAAAIHYREGARSDIPNMARIWSVEGGEGGTSGDRMGRYLDGEHHPRQALLPRVIWVALDGGSLVGYVAGHLTRRHQCDGELQWIYVLPDHRRAGIASELLRRLAGWFVERRALRVCVNVDPTNATALRFYARHHAATMNEHWRVWEDISAVQ
jgi:GNAT superfamily N-acetyltransferase